jgi:FlaA1/EpsC-like NDP-sugar epimerase
MSSVPMSSFIRRSAFARIAVLFLFHACALSACYAFAWLVRFDYAIPEKFLPTLRTSFGIVVPLQLAIGAVLGFYRGWWRYVGLSDVIRLFVGLTGALAVLVGGWYVGLTLGIEPRYVRIPRGVLLIDWAFALLTLFGARVAIRLGRDRFRPLAAGDQARRRVIIVGAGDAGETLAREIEHRPQLRMKVVAFIDDHRDKRGSHIRGVTVHGPISNIAQLAEELSADEALIAIPSASGKRIREIIRELSEAGLPFKTIPGIDQMMSGKVQVSHLRSVNVEDLLSRKRIDLPGDPVRTLFRGKRVLVTGAGGSIGSELAVQVAQFEPSSLVLVERSEYALYEVRKRLTREAGGLSTKITASLVDTAASETIDALLARERPEIVLHAAAHKHVPLGEENPAEYLRNNCLAARTLAERCVQHGVERFVLISTDKAINPTSVMGATKRAAEVALLDLAQQHEMNVTAVRFGNVIGSSGSVIPLFMEQIAAGGPVTVTHPDVTRYFLRTNEAVSLVLQAATLGERGTIFMLDMGEPVKIVDLARDLIRLSNHTEDEMPIVFTGLRPGEKLFEEIRLEGEFVRPTVHPQIVITEPPQPDPATVALWLRAARTIHDDDRAIAALQRLVGEYRPDRPMPWRASRVNRSDAATVQRREKTGTH